jgi:hypothetical protein
MEFQRIVERYIAAWNETDPAARRQLVDDVWAPDARYIDPMVIASGRDEIDATIGAVQAQFPGLTFKLRGPVDAHHDQARFSWLSDPLPESRSWSASTWPCETATVSYRWCWVSSTGCRRNCSPLGS